MENPFLKIKTDKLGSKYLFFRAKEAEKALQDAYDHKNEFMRPDKTRVLRVKSQIEGAKHLVEERGKEALDQFKAALKNGADFSSMGAADWYHADRYAEETGDAFSGAVRSFRKMYVPKHASVGIRRALTRLDHLITESFSSKNPNKPPPSSRIWKVASQILILDRIKTLVSS